MTKPQPVSRQLTPQDGRTKKQLQSNKPEAVAERKRQFLNIYEKLGGGRHFTKACELVGVTRRAAYYWIDYDPEFKAELERIRASSDDELGEEMEDIIVGLARGQTTKDQVPHFQAARHIAAVANPKRHGNKVSHDHSGVVFHIAAPEAKRLTGNIVDVTPALDSGDEEVEE